MTHQQNRETGLRTLNEYFPCTVLLLEDHVRAAVDGFSALPGADTDDGAVNGWLMYLRSGILDQLGVLPFTEDVACYEGAVAALTLNEDACRDAVWFAERNTKTRGHSAAQALNEKPVAGRHVRLERFHYNAPAIVRAIETCDRIEPVEGPAPRTVLLVRDPGEQRPRLMLISADMERLLAACDGESDCAAIARKLAGDDHATSPAKVLDAIEVLRSKNVLSYSEQPNSQTL